MNYNPDQPRDAHGRWAGTGPTNPFDNPYLKYGTVAAGVGVGVGAAVLSGGVSTTTIVPAVTKAAIGIGVGYAARYAWENR